MSKTPREELGARAGAHESGFPMGLIDTHTHLETFARRGEVAATLDRAQAADVTTMITVGTARDDWTLYRDLAVAHPGRVHYTVGLHPCSVAADWADSFAELESFWTQTPRPVALGEIGLDRFHLPKDDPGAAERILDWQRAAFIAELALARRLDCPLVIHSRGAFRECVDLIDASGVAWSRVVFHCFVEGPREMEELRERGGWASFTGILTYRNADNVRAAARVQGLERCLLETDAPYLAPVPVRGQSNEPAFLRHTADYAATLFGVSYAELVTRTTSCARTFFQLPQ